MYQHPTYYQQEWSPFKPQCWAHCGPMLENPSWYHGAQSFLLLSSLIYFEYTTVSSPLTGVTRGGSAVAGRLPELRDLPAGGGALHCTAQLTGPAHY